MAHLRESPLSVNIQERALASGGAGTGPGVVGGRPPRTAPTAKQMQKTFLSRNVAPMLPEADHTDRQSVNSPSPADRPSKGPSPGPQNPENPENTENPENPASSEQPENAGTFEHQEPPQPIGAELESDREKPRDGEPSDREAASDRENLQFNPEN